MALGEGVAAAVFEVAFEGARFFLVLKPEYNFWFPGCEFRTPTLNAIVVLSQALFKISSPANISLGIVFLAAQNVNIHGI